MSKFVFACLEHSLSTQLPEMGCAMLETLSELLLGPTFSTGESVSVKSVQKGALTAGTLSFNLFPYSKEGILFILQVRAETLLPKMRWEDHMCCQWCSVWSGSHTVWCWLPRPREWAIWKTRAGVKAFDMLFHKRDRNTSYRIMVGQQHLGGRKNQQSPAVRNDWVWFGRMRHLLFLWEQIQVKI